MRDETIFEGKLPPEEEEAAAREWAERHTAQNIPCPGKRATH